MEGSCSRCASKELGVCEGRQGGGMPFHDGCGLYLDPATSFGAIYGITSFQSHKITWKEKCLYQWAVLRLKVWDLKRRAKTWIARYFEFTKQDMSGYYWFSISWDWKEFCLRLGQYRLWLRFKR